MDSLRTPRQASASTSQMEATPTTDFALIESQKENIRPLTTGRSAVALSNVFDKSDREVEKVIQEGHEAHQKAIAEAERRDKEGEDMADGAMDLLDVYGRYITFTVQHHPSSASHIIPLLESTTRRFVDDSRYAQDIRHLKHWVMYSRQVERREEIWAFLEAKDVGTRHAEFYEEWALAAEGLGRKKKADEIYRIGIARKAMPLERLKTRHQAFLARIMAPPSGVVPDDDPAVLATRTPGRSILGRVPVPGPAPISGATQLAPSTRISKAHNGAKLEIFTDGKGSASDASAGEWRDFGTKDSRRKENTVEATPWAGETLPQRSVAPRTPKLEVFRDVSDNGSVRNADEVFTRVRQRSNETDMLRSNPLQNFDTSAMSSSLPTIPSLPAPPVARKVSRPKSCSNHFVMLPWECPTDGPEVKDAKGKIQRRMFDWSQVFKNQEEWSFEEVRARQRGLLGKEWRGAVQGWERGWHRPGSSTPKKEVKKSMPSPTVNTKLAAEEVAMMFDQTIHGGKVRDSDSESDSEEEDEDMAAVPPTPLPVPQSVSSTSMLRPSAGMVPPTPTPQGAFPNHRQLMTPSVAVYADENATATGQKVAKFNVFSETPAKTPLAVQRAPLAVASSSKPEGFSIFSEEVESTPSVKSRHPLGSMNSFATPFAEKRPERLAYTETILEESEEQTSPAGPTGQEQLPGRPDGVPIPEDDGGDEAVDYPHDEHFVNINDEEDDEELQRPRRTGRFPQIHEMTPITERTCEFTQMTTFRSENGGTSRRSSSTANIFSTAGSSAGENDGDDAFMRSEPVTVGSSLQAVVEEDDERSRSARSTASPRSSTSPSTAFFDLSTRNENRSGDIGTGFELPDGFTIHGGATQSTSHTMVIVDDRDLTGTRHEEIQDESTAFVTAQHGGIPNPCDPTDEGIIAELLATVEPPLSALTGFVDCRHANMGRLDMIKKFAKSKIRRTSVSNSRVSIAPEEGFVLDLPGTAYEVMDKIGEGGFGEVFLAIDIAARQAQDDADSDDEEDDEGDEDADEKCKVAIKVEKPAAIWEAVILDRLHRRLEKRACSSIIRARQLFAFADESYLVLDFSSQGTLLDVVNKASSIGVAPATAGAPSSMDELLAIFFTIELLRMVESLHRSNFIHGDLKIDNCLVRLESISNSAWSSQYSRDGQNGWSHKGVKLIDFGRGIDLDLFPNQGKGQTFVADWKTDERDCLELRQGRPWSYQADYFGLAGICYCLLFGKYIKTEQIADQERYKIDQPLKRYWQSDLWIPLFDTLLNPTLVEQGQLPITENLTSIRVKFEAWLEENCQKGGKNLRSMLKKIELAALTGKRG